jgi:hypothetical protein
MDPSADMGSAQPSEIEQVYRVCGPSACLSPTYEPDPDFDGTTCQPYEFDGAQAAYYCYGTEPPPSESERCGDGFAAPITLTTEWQIYVIPFTQFQQIGFGKQAPYLDLRSIYQVAFELPVGYTDVYIDNVTFYRRQ